MTCLHRTYSVSMDIELVTCGSDYNECKGFMRDKLKQEIIQLVYGQDYKTEITDEWEEEVE